MTRRQIRFVETLNWLESQLPLLNRKADVALTFEFANQVVDRFAPLYAANECIDLNYAKFLLRKACLRWCDRPAYGRAVRYAYESGLRSVNIDGMPAEPIDLETVQYFSKRIGVSQDRILRERRDAV